MSRNRIDGRLRLMSCLWLMVAGFFVLIVWGNVALASLGLAIYLVCLIFYKDYRENTRVARCSKLFAIFLAIMILLVSPVFYSKFDRPPPIGNIPITDSFSDVIASGDSYFQQGNYEQAYDDYEHAKRLLAEIDLYYAAQVEPSDLISFRQNMIATENRIILTEIALDLKRLDPVDSSVPVSPRSVQQKDPDQVWSSQVGSQLITATQQVGLNGYQLTHDLFLGKLEENKKESIRITLEGGVSYGLIGVCDEDCDHIDLHLYDENDNLIDSGAQRDDYPVIQVQPEWTGFFSIVVEMPNCSAAYCYYGLGAYSQQ